MTIKKKKVLIVGIYMPGIYPSGDDEVVSRLLATAFLKAAADADPDITPHYDIEILDIPTTTASEKIAEEILGKNPDVLAYSAYMWNYDQMSESLKIVKEKRPEIWTLLGGPLVTYTSTEIMGLLPADVVVCGTNAGELRFRQLLKCDRTVEGMKAIPLICFRTTAGDLISTGGSVTEDVSQIPSIYESKAIDLDDGRRHTVFLETFRGCPFSCGYCIWGPEGNTINQFDLDQLLRDIKIIYNHPKVEAVIFTDACLFYTRKRARVICEAIASCSRQIQTVLTLDMHVLDEDMVDHLESIDLYHNQYHFGLQTTNPNAMQYLERPGTATKSGQERYSEKYVTGVDMLRKKIPTAEVSFDLIYGLPGDDYEKFRETIDFALNLKPSKLHFHPLLLLPGTRFFTDREKLNFVYDDIPPYMVKANSTFTEEGMHKAIRYVLWTMAVMYFPAIRDTIFNLRSFIEVKQIHLIDQWIELVEARIDPYAVVRKQHEFTLDAHNLIRRSFMNGLTEPQNCVHAYEAVLELLNSYGAEHLTENVELGIAYYSAIVEGKIDPGHEEFGDPKQLVDQGVLQCKDHSQLESIKTVWVTAEPATKVA
jgi:radical SAM superfamily enzyme YgiQ (UPF0313 family)